MALAFVRQRHGLDGGDLDRIARQQAFIAGLTQRLQSDAVQVAAIQAVPLAHERQRHRSAHGLVARGQVEARVSGVVHGLVQADGHPAEGVGQLHEAREVDLGVVVPSR